MDDVFALTWHTIGNTPSQQRSRLGLVGVLSKQTKPSTKARNSLMPKYVIERNIPNAGKMSPKELNAVSAKSCRVLQSLGPLVQWIQSYVTDEKLFCVYLAPGPELIREHAVRGGFPADAIREVRTVIDPTTAE